LRDWFRVYWLSNATAKMSFTGQDAKLFARVRTPTTTAAPLLMIRRGKSRSFGLS
jgi:hypothetical protein